MHDGQLGKAEGCKSDDILSHGTSYGITIRTKSQLKYISWGKICDPLPGTKADTMVQLLAKLKLAIKDVKVTRVPRESFVFPTEEKSWNTKLPKDLLIRLSAQYTGIGTDYSYMVTINRDGTWYYDGYRGFFVGRFTRSALGKANTERLKKFGKSPSKMPIGRLNGADLSELFAEFEAINFLGLKDKYVGLADPTDNNEQSPCALHNPTETIYLRAVRRAKTVENFTECFTPINKKLTALAKKIRIKLNLE